MNCRATNKAENIYHSLIKGMVTGVLLMLGACWFCWYVFGIPTEYLWLKIGFVGIFLVALLSMGFGVIQGSINKYRCMKIRIEIEKDWEKFEDSMDSPLFETLTEIQLREKIDEYERKLEKLYGMKCLYEHKMVPGEDLRNMLKVLKKRLEDLESNQPPNLS